MINGYRFAKIICLILIPLFCSDIAIADTPTTNSLNIALSGGDATGEVDLSNGCRVKALIESDALIHDINKLKNNGVLNSSASNDIFFNDPSFLTVLVMMEDAETSIYSVYHNGGPVGLCHFDVYNSHADAYGNEQNALMFSFDFTPEIYKKVNWQNFQISNLSNITENFAWTSDGLDLYQNANQGLQSPN